MTSSSRSVPRTAPPRTDRAQTAIAVGRAFAGVVVIGILIQTFIAGIPTRGANPFDYFGYFTNLTSLLASLVLIVTAMTARAIPVRLHELRGVAVACMIIVALIYNIVVPGTGSAPPWVSATLHIVFPALLVLDWTLVLDRPALRWSRLWIVLPYPLLWLAVTLIRGATDGWVPYGFLLPERGGAALLATVVGLLAALLATASVTWLLSRVRLRRR
ncbi:Pr6Pr family membrane protein [Microbacterium sp. ZW T5_45]|uniref:Pr6Pr family membrane protein n=1 Tax=Microbacterium sp. ZW T5_45 TaxID=3378080 RepID=UPI0038549087